MLSSETKNREYIHKNVLCVYYFFDLKKLSPSRAAHCGAISSKHLSVIEQNKQSWFAAGEAPFCYSTQKERTLEVMIPVDVPTSAR